MSGNDIGIGKLKVIGQEMSKEVKALSRDVTDLHRSTVDWVGSKGSDKMLLYDLLNVAINLRNGVDVLDQWVDDIKITLAGLSNKPQ